MTGSWLLPESLCAAREINSQKQANPVGYMISVLKRAVWNLSGSSGAEEIVDKAGISGYSTSGEAIKPTGTGQGK